MIFTYVYFPKNSYLFKVLKKKQLLESNKYLFIKLSHKPNIGELIRISPSSIGWHDNKELRSYLENRKKPLVFRVIDIQHDPLYSASDNKISTFLSIKVYEENIDSHNDW